MEAKNWMENPVADFVGKGKTTRAVTEFFGNNDLTSLSVDVPSGFSTESIAVLDSVNVAYVDLNKI